MAYPETAVKVVSSGTGALQDFDFEFRITASTDVAVTLVHKITGVKTVQILTTDYTVDFDLQTDGGTISFVTAPAATYWVVRESNIANSSTLLLGTRSKYFESQINKGLDRSAIQAQQLAEKQTRAILAPLQVTGFDGEIEGVLAAGRMIKVNSAASGFTFSTSDIDDIDDAVADAGVSAAAALVSQNAAALSAVAALNSANSAAVSAASIDFTKDNSTDLDGALASDSKVPSQLAVKTYVDTAASSTGKILQQAITTSQAADSTTEVIPFDGSVPQITEGKEFLTLAFTPKKTDSTLIIEIDARLNGTAANYGTIALFVGATAGALAADARAFGATSSFLARIVFAVTSASVTARTYRLRYGASANTVVIGAADSISNLGGSIVTSMKITEVAA